MMVIAVGLRNWMVRTGLVILELVGVILSKCRIKVLFLVGSYARVNVCSVMSLYKVLTPCSLGAV
jgi:hypothetical protein